eukprot:GHVR01126296.1.p1 GENE.GHVR01126296.1~~GHVR01126296.1.p1  ORF type:complete len:176 (+),score=22.79 GHVR01126296.1:148-675(+)
MLKIPMLEKKASELADETAKQASSLLEQGTKLTSDTLAYVQQQAQGILGGAKKTDVEGQTKAAADDASRKASDITSQGSKDGEKAVEEGKQTLADLTQQARSLVGDVLNTANEYLKPQEGGQGLVNNVRNTTSNVVDQVAHVISGKDFESLASDVKSNTQDASAQIQSKTNELTK